MSGERRAAPAREAPVRLETERLVLLRPKHEDLDELAALLGDPRVGRWLGGTVDLEAASAFLARHIAHWDAHGFGLWTARDRGTGTFIGRGGLHTTLVDGGAEVEVGWAMVPDRWNEGLATELGAAALRVAATGLGLEQVISFTLPDNRASRRIMEKLGLRIEREFDHRGLPHMLYRGPTRPARPTTPGPAAAPEA